MANVLPVPDVPSRRRWVRRAGWALAIIAKCVLVLALPQRDLQLSVRAGERMLRGEPIYRTDEGAFAYPPLLAMPCVALALLPELVRQPIWCVVNLAALAVIVIRLHRRLWPILAGRRIRAWAFWGLVALLCARHLSAVLENQSHDLLVFLCCWLVVDALAAARPLSAGVLAGLSAALKATPLLFGVLFVWQRRAVAVIGMALALIAGAFLPDLAFPSRDGTSWVVDWYRTFAVHVQPGESAASAGTWAAWNPLNQSMAGTLHRLFTPPPRDQDDHSVCLVELDTPLLKPLTLGCQFGVLAWLLWVTLPRRTRHLPEEQRTIAQVGEGAALLTAMVLLSPMSSKSHFCVLLVPAAYCLADFLGRRRDPLVGAALVAAFVLGTLTAKDLLPRALGERLLTCGAVTWCTLTLFLATGRVLLERSRYSRPAMRPVLSERPLVAVTPGLRQAV